MFQGRASLEDGPGWVKPWRLPHDRKALFPSPDEGLLSRAECTSGVRLRFATDATQLRLTMLPLPDTEPGGGREAFMFDLTQDGDILASSPVPPTGSRADFAGLPPGEKTVELWLPPEVPVALSRLEINDGAQVNPVADERPRWISYGSSLTYCVRVHSPARIWPAIVDVHRRLTGLGEENLYCFNGLDVFDLDLIGRYAEDQCHPNGDGIEIMGDNFDRVVMARMLEGLGK